MGNSRIPRKRLLVWLILLALMLAVAVWTVTCVREPATDSRPQPTITTEDSLATAVAFSKAWAAARPTATATPGEVGRSPTASCTPPNREPMDDSPHFLHWTPDGSQLIFDLSDTIWTVDSQGTRVDAVVDLDPEADYRSSYGFYADLSPDGSRMVYSTCEYPLVVSTSEGAGTPHLYEIALADLDGGGRQRLTQSQGFDSYPVWSPDGDSIAFIRSGVPYDDTWIYLIEDGSEASRLWLEDLGVEAGLSPPAWSPDGESLAFLGYEPTSSDRHPCLYTGTTDELDLEQLRITRYTPFRVTEATGPPSWSPDGQYLAFTRSGGEDAGVYVVRPNGTGLRRIVDGFSKGPLWSLDVTELSENVYMFRGTPAWTSNSKRLLFITREVAPHLLGESNGFVPSRVFTVGLDGGEIVELDIPLPEFLRVTAAAWSPDGSRVAVSGDIRQFPWGELATRRVILTADPDGGNMRILAAGDTVLSLVSGHFDESVGGLFEWNRPDPGSPVDTSPCSKGFVVPNPDENSGLLQDCETLLTIRPALAGRAELNWNVQTSISDWEGITVGGEPIRVRKLVLRDPRVPSAIPPEIGQMTGLRVLNLTLGLTGPIPPELGSLSELQELYLWGNFLSGSIPPELGSLESLHTLNLSGNFLSGSIPTELGNLTVLQELNLSDNWLNGPIPPELGGLVELTRLDLSENSLTGMIPREFSELSRLEGLTLQGNFLTGCIPVKLPRTSIWAEQRGGSRLERCEA